MFTTLSTIFVPTKTGFTSSLPLEYPLLLESTLPALALTCLRIGEQDFCRGFVMVASVEVDFIPEAIGLPLVAEVGLLGTITFNGGAGASDAELGTSAGFLGLDLTVGEVPSEIPGFLAIAGLVLFTEVERLDAAESLQVQDGVEGLRVGVVDLDIDLEVEGVEERAVILEGVEDLARGAMGLLEGTVPLLVGVDDLEGFDFAGRADPLVGVGNLEAVVDFCPTTEDDGLLFPGAQESTLADVDGCLDVSFNEEDSSTGFSG